MTPHKPEDDADAVLGILGEISDLAANSGMLRVFDLVARVQWYVERTRPVIMHGASPEEIARNTIIPDELFEDYEPDPFVIFWDNVRRTMYWKESADE